MPTKKQSKKSTKQTPAKRAKVKKVMHEYKEGKLHSRSKSGPKVKSRKQAIAIAMSEAGVSRKKGSKKKSSKKSSKRSTRRK